jgi:hypothetical protein
MRDGKLVKAISTLSTCFFIGHLCFSQDYTWWNNQHSWDGITHWHEYLSISPGFMGPNALPVPTIKNGKLSKKPNFKIALQKHLSRGDKTENLFMKLYLPLFNPRVGLNIQMVPIEHYIMDTFTRDLRKARDFDGKGLAVGDIYLGTFVQLIEDRKGFPNVLLTFNLKTASGSKLSAARFTDTPGYFFDLSFGKEIIINGSSIKSIRPHVMVGLYVWQTYNDNQRQNDSFLHGSGLDIIFSKIELKNALGGYVGYIGNRDRPMVYRLMLTSRFDSVCNYEFGFQQGIFDFSYTSFEVSLKLDIDKLKSNFKNSHIKDVGKSSAAQPSNPR